MQKELTGWQRLLKEDPTGILEDEKGNELMNSFTNFELEIEVNGNIVNVPIQPVNFGEKQNRWAYSVLSLSAIDKGSEPF